MKKMNRKVMAGLLVLGLGAAGVALANPYWHGGGMGPGHMGGGGPCWGYDGGASASHWRDVGQQRTAYLHDQLKLNATQEKAWKDYQATITANIKAMQDRELIDFSSMTAPERLEKSQQLMKERDARMAKHLEALKAFYSTLSPEQQQVFEAETGPGPGYGYRRGGRWHRGGMGPHY
ncbi:Spy/CpxP family protein refolding chaperone [Oxalobacter vibrioformis]|uniref:Spy/CpxP family protein refolding chaperone n=1 Tax=Oxalobacter vibrioformis TaxID=933080 RepID=A0A9E9P2U7_9BURK|nr:Spy/CpxP family protein refolding chaperone [Oxalobacter vibrioformis]WAW09585.1 Spy/CpxP family protein refolding chaperone [Oxalobacter vibrioformis]